MRRVLLALSVGMALAPVANAAAPTGRYVSGIRSVEDRRSKLVWRKVVFSERLNWSSAEA